MPDDLAALEQREKRLAVLEAHLATVEKVQRRSAWALQAAALVIIAAAVWLYLR